MSDERSIENRTLEISNFRNLGPFCSGKKKEKNDDREFLKINRSLERDSLGGLVILVGVNNSGKSNVLEALERFQSQKFLDSDYTDFTLAGKIKPCIDMNLANGTYNVIVKKSKTKSYTYSGEWAAVVMIFLLEEESYKAALRSKIIFSDISYDRYAQDMCNIVIKMMKTSVNSQELGLVKTMFKARTDVETINIVIDGKGKVSSDDDTTKNPKMVYENGNIIMYECPKIISSKNPYYFKNIDPESTITYVDGFHNCINNLLNYITKHADRLDIKAEASPEIEMDDNFKSRYGYSLGNRVYKYTRERIHDSDLRCNPSTPNQFFLRLLETAGYSAKTITQAYEGNANLRIGLEKKLNQELRMISTELNELLNIKEKRYSLGIRLENKMMQFLIFSGDDVTLNLDRQSQGFTWLFELYFNLLKSNTFNPGDMVLIDEFGDSLGFSTVQELTKKLRNYGLKNGITFILATQNPMAIDITHLDEVRLVVPHLDGSSEIVNQFDRYGNIKDHDAVGPVINGLMVSRNFMRRENRRTVFVEGAMDYFYLNSFSDQFRSEGMPIDLDFIPMNGLGAREDDPASLLDQIRSIEHSPMILVDSDGKGKQIIKAASRYNDVKVIGIGERLEGKKEIEDLFSKSDAEKLMVQEKSFDRGASISHTFPKVYGDLEEETKQNFKNLIEYIMDA